jgi:hypothetical protein
MGLEPGDMVEVVFFADKGSVVLWKVVCSNGIDVRYRSYRNPHEMLLYRRSFFPVLF